MNFSSQSRTMMLIIIVLYVPVVQSLYARTRAGLVKIPHSDINDSEDEIDLSRNGLTSLGADEFSRYSNLTVLKLSINRIGMMSAFALCGTSIINLDMQYNRLTVFPNLTCVADRLEVLNLRSNRIITIDSENLSVLTNLVALILKFNAFTEHPDFTSVSSEADGWTYLSIDDTYPNAMTTICHFSELQLRGDNLVTVPRFSCPETQSPGKIELFDYNFGTVTDFRNLSSLSLHTLDFYKCNLTVFPNLGTLKAHLLWLRIAESELKVIHSSDLGGLELLALALTSNPIKTIPAEIFHVANRLDLNTMDLAPRDSLFWSMALCSTKSKNLNHLNLEESVRSLALIPPITKALCSREQTLTVNLMKAQVPCDCSISWMAEAALRCPVKFLIDHLPCRFSNWTELEIYRSQECPESFMIVENAYGEDILLTEASSIPSTISLKRLIVRGEPKWLVNTTNASNESKWIFGEGTFTAGEDFIVANSGLYAQPFSPQFTMDGYNATALNESCDNTTHNVLMDGLPQSCISLQLGVQYLSLFPNSSAPRSGSVMLQTQGLPCSEAFHVMVSAVCPQSCPMKQQCHLETSVTMTTGESSCWFHCSCPSSDIVQQLDIRLATYQLNTNVCEALWLDEF